MVLRGPLVEGVSSYPSVPLSITTMARPMAAWIPVGEQKRLARCHWPILTGPRQESQREETAPSTEAQVLRKLGLEKGRPVQTWEQQEACGWRGSAVHLRLASPRPTTLGHGSGQLYMVCMGVSLGEYTCFCTHVCACLFRCAHAYEHVPVCVNTSVSCMYSGLGRSTCQSAWARTSG